MAKKRPAPILDHDNHERWFRVLELHFKGEALWSTVVNGAALHTEFEQKDAKAQYILDICIGDGDRERVQSCQTARDVWTTLKKRYEDKRPSVSRHYLHEYVTYRMPEDGSVQEAWTNIQRLARHVKSTNPAMKEFASQTQMFQQLLASLPPSYDAIRDAIDAQGIYDVDVSFQNLLEKESSLKSSHHALVSRFRQQKSSSSSYDRSHSRQRAQHQTKRYQRSSSPERPRKTLKCFACRGEHKWRECPHIEENMLEIRAIVEKARSKRKAGTRHRAHIEQDEECSTDAEDFSSGAEEEEEAFTASSQTTARDP